MEFTAWRIWLHPKAARREIEELRRSLDENGDRLREAVELQGALQLRVEQLLIECEESETREASEISALRDKLRHTETLLRGLERERDELRMEVDERKDAETQIKEFESRLSEFGKVKDRYEERIRLLRAELKRVRQTSASVGTKKILYDEIDLAGEIEMDGTSVSGPSAAPSPPPAQAPDPEDNWLEIM